MNELNFIRFYQIGFPFKRYCLNRYVLCSFFFLMVCVGVFFLLAEKNPHEVASVITQQVKKKKQPNHSGKILFPKQSVSQLKLIGTLISKRKRWGLVLDQKKSVTALKENDLVAVKHYVVKKIMSDQIVLIAPKKKQPYVMRLADE